MGQGPGRLLLSAPLRTRFYRVILFILLIPAALFASLAVRNAMHRVSGEPWITFLLVWSGWAIIYYVVVCRLLDRLRFFELGIRRPFTHGYGPLFLPWAEILAFSWQGNTLCLNSAGEVATFSIPKVNQTEVRRILAQFACAQREPIIQGASADLS